MKTFIQLSSSCDYRYFRCFIRQWSSRRNRTVRDHIDVPFGITSLSLQCKSEQLNETTPFYRERGSNSLKYLRSMTRNQMLPDFISGSCQRRRTTINTNSFFPYQLLATSFTNIQTRYLAFITGHANTKKKNKKKRAAKAIENNHKLMKKKVMTDEEYKKHQLAMKLQRREKMSKNNSKTKKVATKKRPSFDPSTTPNYPLGPNGLTDMIENEDGTTTIITPEERTAAAVAAANESKKSAVTVPPAVLLPTGSPHVFVAKVACQELNIDPRTQLFASSKLYLRHDTKLRTAYTFEPYGPLFAMSSSNHGSSKNHNLAMSDKPEVAFLGRSNVGKSSLVNALMNKTLAVTSKQPGRTQQAYYYGWIPSQIHTSFLPKNSSIHPTISTSTTSSHITSIPIAAVNGFLVDLPGYGYAVGPDSTVETWQVATQDYLRQRRDAEALKRVFVLQDARLQTPQHVDGDVLRWLEDEQIPHTVVLTKADDHHAIMNKSSSTAGVIKHANICCFRYYQLWTESGATLPEDDVNGIEQHEDHDSVDEEEALSDGEEEEYEDEEEADVPVTRNSSDEWYDENTDETQSDEGLDDHVQEDEEEQGEEMVGTIMLSPVVHVTSAKKQTGLAELLSSIESEFIPDPIE